jgi:hypothetical protein
VNPAKLRARCEARLAGLFIPHPFDLTTFCAHVGSRRGRPIRLLPMELGANSPSGLWIRGEGTDFIVYEQATTPLHQTHIALHEIGHLLCDHESAVPPHGEHLGRLFPTLDPQRVRQTLSRTSYSSEDESEAEMLASLILQQTYLHPDQPPLLPSAESPTAQILRRLESGL